MTPLLLEFALSDGLDKIDLDLSFENSINVVAGKKINRIN